MAQLILHAGPPKSGSTAIQRGLEAQAEPMREAGIHYYSRPAPWHWALVLPYRAENYRNFLPLVLRKSFATVEAALDWCEDEWRLFENWCVTEQPGTVVISSEHLSFGGDKAALVNRLAGHFDDIHVIGYARDPVEAYVSGLEELVRTGWEFADLPSPLSEPSNSARSLRAYEEIVGAGNLHIGRFSRSHLAAGDVVYDFLDRLGGITGCPLPTPENVTDANPGVCGAAVAWFLTINQEQKIRNRPAEHFKPFFNHRKRLVTAFRQSRRMHALPRLAMTDPVLRNAVLRKSQATLKWLNRDHLPAAQQFDLPDRWDPLPDRQEAQDRLANWLRSYLTPEALEILFDEIAIRGHGAA